MVLDNWAIKWGIPLEALSDLRRVLGPTQKQVKKNLLSTTESEAQACVTIEAKLKGCILWRNNVGVLIDKFGRPVRFGLANDSKKVNEVLKSSDLIGIRPVKITQDMVGKTIGQFLCREMKKPGWKYKSNPREVAQLNFLNQVRAMGGDAEFSTGEGTI